MVRVCFTRIRVHKNYILQVEGLEASVVTKVEMIYGLDNDQERDGMLGKLGYLTFSAHEKKLARYFQSCKRFAPHYALLLTLKHRFLLEHSTFQFLLPLPLSAIFCNKLNGFFSFSFCKLGVLLFYCFSL